MSAMLPLEAIADPTRLSILRHLGEAGPSTLVQIVSGTGAHPNTVRHHVAALQKAGVLEPAEPDRPARGRPRNRFQLRGSWTLPSTDFRGLAEVLAQLVRLLEPSPAMIRKIGHAWGRYFRGRPGERKLEKELPPVLERLGFLAQVDGREIRVSGCPCPLVLPEDPAIVCKLMTAVVEGYLQSDVAAAGAPTIRSAQHDPRRRSCTLRLESRAAHP
jgi:predicted ArsR family transcriptional regulator